MGMLPLCRKRPVGIREHRAWYGHLVAKRHVPRICWIFYFCGLGIFALAVVFAITESPDGSSIPCFKADADLMHVKGLAYEAYPQWSLANIHERCPKTLADLSKYRNSSSTKDSWGNEVIMECDATHAFAVISMGPDGTLGTDDDIRSSD